MGFQKWKTISNEFNNYKEHLTLHKFVHTFPFENMYIPFKTLKIY